MLAGVVGLFAVFKSNALTAKIYLWTWLPRFVLGVVSEYAVRAQMKELGIDNSDGVPVVIGELIGVVVVLYYIKVGRSQRRRCTGTKSDDFPVYCYPGEAKWGRRPSVLFTVAPGNADRCFSGGSLLVGGHLQDHVDVVVVERTLLTTRGQQGARWYGS